MTENLPMEYVPITKDDIVKVLNSNTAVYATEYPRNERTRNFLHQFYIKGLYFTWINGNIYTAQTSYGKKKLYFELNGREDVEFDELDIIDDESLSNLLHILNLHHAKHLMVNGEIFYWLDRNSGIVDYCVDNSLINDIKWTTAVESIYEKFGYNRNNLQRLNMNMEVRDSYIRSISIDRDENVATYADITRASSLASEYMNNYSIPMRAYALEGEVVSYDGENIGRFDGMDVYIDRGVNSTIKPNMFSYSKKDKEIRDFIDGPGMFKIGVKKFKVLPIKEQWKKINDLDYVLKIEDIKSIEKDDECLIKFDLKDKGEYEIELKSSPSARRLDTKQSWYNPFISQCDRNKICLGNIESTYENCWNNGNYLECVKIIKEVLTCEDDSNCYSGQKWRELKKIIKDGN